MLIDLYPRCHRRYSSLPVLGPALDGFIGWLFKEGYPRPRVRQHVRTARGLDDALRKRGVRTVGDVTRERLRACSPADSQDDADRAATVRLWERYLDTLRLLAPPDPPSCLEVKIAAYATFLENVRGLASSTVTQHLATASAFLAHLRYEAQPSNLGVITGGEIEAFVRASGKRISRTSLQHTIAQLRSFLRFLVSQGEITPGLDLQIDTPRVYRLEQLPRALPWPTGMRFPSLHRSVHAPRLARLCDLPADRHLWAACERDRRAHTPEYRMASGEDPGPTAQNGYPPAAAPDRCRGRHLGGLSASRTYPRPALSGGVPPSAGTCRRSQAHRRNGSFSSVGPAKRTRDSISGSALPASLVRGPLAPTRDAAQDDRRPSRSPQR